MSSSSINLQKIFSSYAQENSFKNVIYTAVFGNFDNLSEIQNPDKNTGYFCFTDNKNFSPATWNVIYCDINIDDFRKFAKIFKIFPHKFFPNAEITLWVDGNYIIKKTHKKFFEKYKENLDIKFFKHSFRNCIFKEANYLIKNKREFDPICIKNQLSHYKKNGMQKNNGLINGAIILRNNKNRFVQNLMYEWWFEIETYSIRDQLSFNYVCWKNQHQLKYFDEKIIDFQFFQFIPHGSVFRTFSYLNVKILIKQITKKIRSYVNNP